MLRKGVLVALGYRTVLTADASGVNLDRVLGILKRWAVAKKRFPNLPVEGMVENGSGGFLAAMSYSSEASVGYRWVLREGWPPPVFALERGPQTGETRITLVSESARLWFCVDVEPPTITVPDAGGGTHTEIQYSGTPSFVPQVIEEVEMRDGAARPLSGFQAISSGAHVGELLEVVEDDVRIGAVFVTAPPRDSSIDDWTARLERSMHTLQGLGVGYVLHPDAQREFNEEVGFGHSIPSGGMRTFLPGAVPGDRQDAFRHKLLTPSALHSTDERRIRRILRNAQIRRVDDIRLPDVLRDADYEFLRLRQMQPFQVLRRDVQEELDSKPSEAVITELRQSLKDAESIAEEAADDNLRLANEARTLREDRDWMQLELDESEQVLRAERLAAEKLNARVSWLQGELMRLGGEGALVAFSVPEEVTADAAPESFEDLLRCIAELPGVVFYGDRDAALELDEQSALGPSAVTKAWDALVTFDAYVRARKSGVFDGSLSTYISNPQHGLPMRVSSVVWTESPTVRNDARMAGERVATGLPPSVSDDGRLTMFKHVCLVTRRGNSPRLYFEDTFSQAGHVAVGHLGGHLTNTLTN